jgi:HK97 family phage major capsid protein
MTDIDKLAARRDGLRSEAEDILERAEGDISGADATRFDQITDEVNSLNGRIGDLRGDELRRQNATRAVDRLAGQPVERGGGQRLSADDADLARAFRSAIFSKNPQPIEVYARDLGDEWPADMPEVQGRSGRVRVHTRDTLKTTATQALSVDVYSTIVQHLVETSSLMAAGATVVTTSTGEDLVVPRSTGFVTTNLIAEGASITESDPTLSAVTLKAYKYANYFEISQELANDSPTNLLSFLATQAALSLGLGTTGFGNHLINGTGTGQPRGLLLDAATGVTGPVGTATSLGTQGTVAQGTDALWSVVGSVAEPYAAAPSAAFLLRNASDIVVRKLRDTTGQPVQGLGERGRILGYPSYLDPFMPAMAANAESIAFGDMSKYFVRIVNGVRFERSDEFRFQDDLVAFRCIIRLDGALIDTGAVKTFANSAT